jgi:hypothetical protein
MTLLVVRCPFLLLLLFFFLSSFSLGSPLKRRVEQHQACWCECRSIPGGLYPHHINDKRTPIAALRNELRLSEALHQHDPGTCNAYHYTIMIWAHGSESNVSCRDHGDCSVGEKECGQYSLRYRL